MTEGIPRILVLGLGNDILGDDAVGLLAARRLRALLPETVDVVESGGGGLDLLDALEGYDRAVLLDAILTGKHPPGTILEFSAEDFKKDDAPSPHYAGLPTVIQLAESLGIRFPTIFQIVAVEVENPYEVLEGLSQPVETALPAIVERVRRIVHGWLFDSSPPSHQPAPVKRVSHGSARGKRVDPPDRRGISGDLGSPRDGTESCG